MARASFNRVGSWIIKFRYPIAAISLTAYGVYLRFVSLANRFFPWADEAYLIETLQGEFKPFWQRFTYTDFTYFPGEYIINRPFVFLFPLNKWNILIPHILFTFLTFYLLYLICKRYFHSIFAWIATFALVAVHRDLVFHSFELRPYAVLPALALAVFYFSEAIVSSYYRLSPIQKASIGFVFVFTVIFHAYGAVILFFIIAYFILRELTEKPFKEVFKHNYRFLSVITVICLPLFLWYSMNNVHTVKGMGKSVFEYIPSPALDIYGFVKVVLCCLIGNKFLYPLAVLLTCPFFLPYKQRLQQIIFLLIIVVAPILSVLLISILSGYWFIQRQFIWVMPLFAFLVGWCLDSFIGFIQSRKQRVSL